MFVERDLELSGQVSLFEGLQDVAKWTDRTGFFNGLMVRMRSQENDRDIPPPLQTLSRLNSVQLAVEADVQEGKVGTFFLSEFNGFLSGGNWTDDAIAEHLDFAGEMSRQDGLIFHD
jgi:hypothetical protein